MNAENVKSQMRKGTLEYCIHGGSFPLNGVLNAKAYCAALRDVVRAEVLRISESAKTVGGDDKRK